MTIQEYITKNYNEIYKNLKIILTKDNIGMFVSFLNNNKNSITNIQNALFLLNEERITINNLENLNADVSPLKNNLFRMTFFRDYISTIYYGQDFLSYRDKENLEREIKRIFADVKESCNIDDGINPLLGLELEPTDFVRINGESSGAENKKLNEISYILNSEILSEGKPTSLSNIKNEDIPLTRSFLIKFLTEISKRTINY